MKRSFILLRKIFFLCMAITLFHCGSELDFHDGGKKTHPASKDVIVVDAVDGGPGKDYAYQVFQYGSPQQPVDYLFVLDNSISMSAIVNLVQKAFQELDSDSFPLNAKLGVMTTLIGDPSNWRETHPVVSRYPGIEWEPGFLDLVNGAAIDRYRLLVPDQATNWTINGCADGWFKPDDVNSEGISCLVAATQSTFARVQAEAGITAYEQLMLKRTEMNLGPIFREGTIANVIFVSDTHDPGVNNRELRESRKNFQQLVDLTKKDNLINRINFHAIAPERECGVEGLFDFSYFNLVAASGGLKTDSCTTADYKDFIKNMIELSKIPEPDFILGIAVSEIIEVQVNGISIENFTISEDKQKIRIESLDPNTVSEIKIFYKKPGE